jgi:hypothetical protein
VQSSANRQASKPKGGCTFAYVGGRRGYRQKWEFLSYVRKEYLSVSAREKRSESQLALARSHAPVDVESGLLEPDAGSGVVGGGDAGVELHCVEGQCMLGYEGVSGHEDRLRGWHRRTEARWFGAGGDGRDSARADANASFNASFDASFDARVDASASPDASPSARAGANASPDASLDARADANPNANA